MKNCNKNIEKRNPLWYYYFHKSINSEEDEMTQKKGALRLFVYEAEQKGGEFMKRKLSLVLALMMAAGLRRSGRRHTCNRARRSAGRGFGKCPGRRAERGRYRH